MNLWFIDAENMGRKTLEQLAPPFRDKVWVFSKNEAAKTLCEERFYFYQSAYQVGSNQADFYLLAVLSQVLTALGRERNALGEYLLLSNDKALKQAFLSECRRRQVTGRCVRVENGQAQAAPAAMKPEKNKPNTANEAASREQQLLEILQIPCLYEAARSQMKLDKSAFSKVFQKLLREQKIERDKENQKRWVARLM